MACDTSQHATPTREGSVLVCVGGPPATIAWHVDLCRWPLTYITWHRHVQAVSQYCLALPRARSPAPREKLLHHLLNCAAAVAVASLNNIDSLVWLITLHAHHVVINHASNGLASLQVVDGSDNTRTIPLKWIYCPSATIACRKDWCTALRRCLGKLYKRREMIAITILWVRVFDVLKHREVW